MKYFCPIDMHMCTCYLLSNSHFINFKPRSLREVYVHGDNVWRLLNFHPVMSFFHLYTINHNDLYYIPYATAIERLHNVDIDDTKLYMYNILD